MSKIDFKEERIPRIQKILDHARATINLFSNVPQVVKYQFRDRAFFIDLELLDKKGLPRTLTYFVKTEVELNAIVNEFVERYGIEAIEIMD